MTIDTGGPLHPMTPFLFINGDLDEKGFDAIANLVASNAKTGATRLDFFAAQAMSTLLADSDESTDLEEIAAKAFNMATLMLKFSRAMEGKAVDQSKELAKLREERKSLITEVHDLKGKLKKFSKSSEVPTREVTKDEEPTPEND